MQTRFVTTFLAITLIAVMVIGMQIEPVDAKKAQGTYTQKFGSATKHIVCGDKLCDEENIPKQSSITTTKITMTTNMCNKESIQMKSSCLSFNIDSGTVKDSVYDNLSGSTTIQIQSSDNGRIIINAALDSAFILVDGEEWDDVIVSGSSTTIEFLAGTETIEIFGR
jgi:hypothetical protein